MKYDKALTGKRLKALRELLDLSQGQVAAVLNVDRSTYAYYELGRSHLSAEKLASLACRYRVSSDFILGLTEQETDRALEARAAQLVSWNFSAPPGPSPKPRTAGRRKRGKADSADR